MDTNSWTIHSFVCNHSKISYVSTLTEIIDMNAKRRQVVYPRCFDAIRTIKLSSKLIAHRLLLLWLLTTSFSIFSCTGYMWYFFFFVFFFLFFFAHLIKIRITSIVVVRSIWRFGFRYIFRRNAIEWHQNCPIGKFLSENFSWKFSFGLINEWIFKKWIW